MGVMETHLGGFGAIPKNLKNKMGELDIFRP